MQGFCPKCGGGVCGVRERERVRYLVCLHLELKLKLHGTFFYLISSKFSVPVYSVKFIFGLVSLSLSLFLSLYLPCLLVSMFVSLEGFSLILVCLSEPKGKKLP